MKRTLNNPPTNGLPVPGMELVRRNAAAPAPHGSGPSYRFDQSRGELEREQSVPGVRASQAPLGRETFLNGVRTAANNRQSSAQLTSFGETPARTNPVTGDVEAWPSDMRNRGRRR